MKKMLTAAVAALTIATAIAASTANADAKGFKWGGGWGWKPYYGYGIAAGVLGAAAFGAYAACDRVPVYNHFGELIGFRRICGY
jgi:hypothetical protein